MAGLLEGNDLYPILNGTDSNHTIFAPTNASFTAEYEFLSSLSAEDLKSMLETHIVVGKIETLEPGAHFTTLSGHVLKVGVSVPVALYWVWKRGDIVYACVQVLMLCGVCCIALCCVAFHCVVALSVL